MAPGTEFSGYRIQSVLGRGGMSVVYAAEHVRLGRMVALKVLSHSLATDATFRERFIRESQLAAALDHPNIIPIYDAGESEGFLYIAMRHVEGSDLGSLIEQEGPLPLGQTLFYIEQVASALDQAHEQGLIHRDVKPANVLIARPSDRAFLTDFGVVKQTSSRGLTKAAYFLGTYEYAAPEQIEGKEIDRRTDLYALGCILYECLSAEPPFVGDTEGSVIHAHLAEPPPRLSAKRPDVPLALTDIIATAMAKKKEDRFATCGDLVRALRAVALGTSGGQSIVAAPATVHAAAPAAAGATVLAGAGAPPVPPPSTGEQPAVPPAAPPPESQPATPPPGPPSDGKSVSLSGKKLALIAAAIAIPIAAVIAGFMLLGGDDDSTANPPTTAPTVTDGNEPAGDTGFEGLARASFLSQCEKAPTREGASRTITCEPSGSANFEDLELSLYSSSSAMRASYDQLKEEFGITEEEFGRCDGAAWEGEAEWLHNSGKVGGRRFCTFAEDTATGGQKAVIIWTHERLGQPSHRDMIGVARHEELASRDLSRFFNFWKEELGKCPDEGCTAPTVN
jgi:hypothetical protein